jgi:hypothetical protein
MGEMADAVLEGVFCQECGVWMGDDQPPGYPQTCRACGGDSTDAGEFQDPRVGSFACSVCLGLPKTERKKYRFKSEYALEQHLNSGAHRHTCPDCSRVYLTARSLADHRAMKHGAGPAA